MKYEQNNTTDFSAEAAPHNSAPHARERTKLHLGGDTLHLGGGRILMKYAYNGE
jgi:hypothetical protein